MTRFDDILGKSKEMPQSKKLRLILDEDDEIINSISKAMLEHKLLKVKLETIHGFLIDGIILSDNNKERITVKDKEIISANATFSLTNGDLWGTLSIFVDKIKPITGKLIRGTVKDGCEILLSFEEKDVKKASKK